MEIYGPDGPVVGHRVVLGPVVGMVFRSLAPMDTELALSDAIADPVEAHVDGFGLALFDAIIDDAIGHFIIRLDGRGRLGMSQSLQCVADGAGFPGIVEEAGNFGFGGGREYLAHDAAQDVNGTIGLPVGLGICFAAEVEVAPGSGAGFGLGQVGGITVYHEEHVTGMVTNGDGGVSGGVVQQMGKCFHCGLGAAGLCCGQGAKRDEHGVVYRAGIVQECA